MPPLARVLLVGFALASAVSAFTTAARAQDCGCDHTIAPGTGGVDGTALGIGAGDVVCLMAGDYEYIRFREIRGSQGNPVLIKNCGGVVDVANSDRGYGVDFQGSSSFFHITGSGEPGVEYGIRISASRRGPDYPGMGLWFLDKSTNYEADHLEVHDAGFAGVMAKTDPLCDGSADQGTFVQRDVHLHHLWVHHTGGEGFYVGSTQANGQTIQCNGAGELHQPHFLEGIEIDHNLVEDTEWDGMQVGMAQADCSVHDNVIRRVGSAREDTQEQVLQIGSFSRCDVRRNTLTDGPAMGIIVLDSHDTLIADNVIAHVGGDGIYANLRPTDRSARYRMIHNTIVDFAGSAIRVFGAGLTDSGAQNNFVIGSATDINAGGNVGWEAADNVFAATVTDAQFLGANDFHIAATSPARGAGRDLTTDGFALDRDSRPRETPPSAGAYEFAEDVVVVDAGMGGDAATSDNDASITPPKSKGGCSCSATGAPLSSLPPALLVALALARRRGREQRR